MKQKFNLHTHTWRCGHAIGNDYQYIENAIVAGFQCLGFSEHIQYRADNGKYNRINFEDFEEYFIEINRLKRQYKSEIEILCGLEAAYVPEAMQDLIDLRKRCDFVLLGQHQGGLNDRKYGRHCDDIELQQYTDEIINGVETGLYNIIAHPDYFMCSRNNWSKICEKSTYKICLAAKLYNIPLELNIKGSYTSIGIIDGKRCVKYPFRRFWEIAADIGNEVLYGLDAHAPEEMLRTTERIDDIIKGLKLNMIETLKPYI